MFELSPSLRCCCALQGSSVKNAFGQSPCLAQQNWIPYSTLPFTVHRIYVTKLGSLQASPSTDHYEMLGCQSWALVSVPQAIFSSTGNILSVPQAIFESVLLPASASSPWWLLLPTATLKNTFSILAKSGPSFSLPSISSNVFYTYCQILYLVQEFSLSDPENYSEWKVVVQGLTCSVLIEGEQGCAMLLNGNINSLNTMWWDQWK